MKRFVYISALNLTMLSKLFVLRVSRFALPSVRHLGGLTPLEKFEKLRKLCCTSDLAKKSAEYESKIRPRTPEVEPCDKSCNECCGNKLPELLDVRCKTAMVIGGGSGIGYETADCLLKSGAMRVIIADVNQCAGVDAVKKLCAAHGNSKAVFLMTDIAEQPSIEMAFKEVYKYFCQLDIYINTAGIYNETPQCWDKMIRNNLIGCVRGTLLAYKYMSGNTQDDCCQGSVIINVASYGSLGNVPSMPLFSAAANGILGLTSSFGQDFHYSRTKVRCVTVCPACTDSGLLKYMNKFHYDPQWAGFSNAAMKCCTKQSAKVVGKAIVNAARYGANGSVYVVKEGKYYRYVLPDYVKYMRQETVLL